VESIVTNNCCTTTYHIADEPVNICYTDFLPFFE